MGRVRSQSCDAAGRRRPEQSAFTLLENLFAGFLLVIIFFVLFTLYPTSILSLRQGHDMVAASNYAQQLMERSRTTPFDNLATGTPLPAIVDGITFSSNLSVTPDAAGDVKSVTVTVRWDTGRPRPEGGDIIGTLSYSTLLYRFTNPGGAATAPAASPASTSAGP